MTTADAPSPEHLPKQASLNYMEKPHRFTPGPGGNCLFCSHTQRWHTENRPKTPAEVEQEKKDRAIQEKNDLALGSSLMLTALPTEQDALQAILADKKMQTQAEQVAGAPLQDPNDPATAAGVDPKMMKKALIQALAKKMHGASELTKPDIDFSQQMIIHHRAAVKMATDFLAANPDDTSPVAAWAKEILAGQQKEIKTVQGWLDSAGVKSPAKSGMGKMGKSADSKEAAPLVNVQYDENKKSGGLSEPERKKLADEGVAMEDGTFPIRDEQDLKVALTLWGKATDPHGAREHIIVRAVELGLEDSLPQNFKDYRSNKNGKETDGASDPTQPDPATVKKAAYAVTKSADEKRYTLGPMYIPNRLDAHNEFATADELQKAVWDYVRNGDRQIRLQHNTSIVAGECVEVLSWPDEITTALSLPTGTLQKAQSVTFPAGTTYMGIVWEPWAWEMVKKGKITGLSMGGWAKRTSVTVEGLDLPTPDEDPKVLKYSPDQPRDKYGRWTDGNVSFKPGNWFDRNVMGTPEVTSDRSPTSISPSREAGNAAANIIGDRKKWTGPYDAETKTWTPFDPDKVWRDLPKEKKSVVGKFMQEIGITFDVLRQLMTETEGQRAERHAKIKADSSKVQYLTGHYSSNEERRQERARLLAKAMEDHLAEVAKHGQKGAPGYRLLHPGTGRAARTSLARPKYTDADGKPTNDPVEAVNPPTKGAVNPKAHARRYGKPDADGKITVSSSTGQTVSEADVEAYLAAWAPPSDTEFDRTVSEAADSVLDRAEFNEPFLTAALRQQAKVQGGELVGLEFKLKTKKSLMRKIKDKAEAKGITPAAYAEKVADSLRYTMLLPNSTFIEDSRNTLRGLRDSGYKITSIENTWARGDAYSGLHATIISPDGHASELQFHTKASFDNKSTIHKDYDVYRDPTTPTEVRDFLDARMAKTWQGVPQPKGWKSFGDLIAF